LLIGEVTRSVPVSEVLLVTDMDRTGLDPSEPETDFLLLTSLAGWTISTSSFGIDAILVRKSFSKVCAMTTISSPALL
jgi:hypothetical protein